MIFISKCMLLKVFSAYILLYIYLFLSIPIWGPSFLIYTFTKFLAIRNFDKFSKSAEFFSCQIKVENTVLHTTESVIF